MPKFVIERDIPGIGGSSDADLAAAAQKSCEVLLSMEESIQWVESFVTDNKTYCVYLAPDRAAIEHHARESGFPADSIQQVRAIIDPSTAEVA